MDSKLTLSFNKDVIAKAKDFASKQNISLSRLIEHLLTQATAKPYQSLEDFEVADWVSMIAEPEGTYKQHQQSRKSQKAAYFTAKK